MTPPSTLAQLPVVLLPGRWRQALLLVACVTFTALGVFMVQAGSWAGYPLALLFGLGCVVAAVNLHPRAAYLRLDKHGFTCCSMFRGRTVPWQDSLRFGVIRIQTKHMVAWTSAPGVLANSFMRSLNRALVDYDFALPNTYGIKAQILADAMQQLRDESVAASTAARFTTAVWLNQEAETRSLE